MFDLLVNASAIDPFPGAGNSGTSRRPRKIGILGGIAPLTTGR